MELISTCKRSQAKGRRAEIELAGLLQERGYNVRPGEPLNFGREADIVGLAGIHCELKRREGVDLSAALFSKVCQSELGSPLSYVIFTLPPVSQGELYQDYKGEGDYGMKVSSTQKYGQSEINDLTFVPAPGFSGTVRIGYAGYSVSGGKYTGRTGSSSRRRHFYIARFVEFERIDKHLRVWFMAYGKEKTVYRYIVEIFIFRA